VANPEDAYRSALDAAHARIAQLEAAAKVTAPHPKVPTLEALHRERARAAAAIEEPRMLPTLVKAFYIPMGVAAIAFAIDGDWPLAAVAPFLAVAVTFVTRAIVRSNAAAAAHQLELVNAKIHEVEREIAGG
jgi:hypothetical protein